MSGIQQRVGNVVGVMHRHGKDQDLCPRFVDRGSSLTPRPRGLERFSAAIALCGYVDNKFGDIQHYVNICPDCDLTEAGTLVS